MPIKAREQGRAVYTRPAGAQGRPGAVGTRRPGGRRWRWRGGIDYIYADAPHPNSLVPEAILIARSGEAQVLRLP